MANEKSQGPRPQRASVVNTELGWLPDELENLLFLAERAGFSATARDLRYAIRSAEVELRQHAVPMRKIGWDPFRISRDGGKQRP